MAPIPPKARKASPVGIVFATLLVLLLAMGWQGNELASSSRALLPLSKTAEGMDAGVAAAATPSPSWGSMSTTSAAIAARRLEPEMLQLDEGARPPVPACRAPRVTVPASEGCAEGLPYPDCRWRVPSPPATGYILSRWRNTSLEHWWGRPALVTVVLAAARGYAERFPGERLMVGDLDAPGPRHHTHDHGVDVDLYLPGDMENDNAGTGDYPSNYIDHPELLVRLRRARVEALAKILASCTDGALRIFYNDRPVAEHFVHWFRRRGLVSPFGRPMQPHNELHRFHFHVTIPKSLPPLPGPRGKVPDPSE